MWEALFAIAALVAAGLAVVCAYLLASRRAAAAEWDRGERQLSDARVQIGGLTDENAALIGRLERSEATLEQVQKQHVAAQQQAREAFRSLSADALKSASEQFLQLAKKTFEGDQKDAVAAVEQRKAAIEAMIKPIRETMDKHARAVTEIEKNREGAYHGLRQQLASMVEDQKALRGETRNLVKALRRPEVRGRWGEMQLRRVAELAGMISRCDFTEQTTTNTEEGRLRPDMVIRLPGGREIVVDAKTPLAAFIDSIEAPDDQQRDRFLDDHARQVEEQVKKLAAKDYRAQSRSPDFVVLFIPGESFLSAALQRQPGLMESAMRRDVVIATPSTLIALLKAVAAGWREQRIAESAEQIRDLGQQLHERIAVAAGYIENLGSNLERAVKSYNQFVGSFETRVLTSARRFKDLGADSSKELPAEGSLPQIEAAPREIKAQPTGAEDG